jgi:hypothetical protein
MPIALEGISGYATHPTVGTFAALTMSGSDLNTIRSFDISKVASLIATWIFTQKNGVFRIRSPRLHDNVQGIRQRSIQSIPDPIIYGGQFMQPLYSQDALILELTLAVADAAGNQEYAAAMIYYPDLPGITSSLISIAQLKALGLELMGQDVAITTTNAGGYTGSVAINAEAGCDNMKANQWYALLGATVDTACCAVRIQGADVGNLGLLVPGNPNDQQLMGRWFVALSEYCNLPLIPCFNSANKTGILVSAAQNDGAAAVNASLIFVRLNGTPTFGK